MKPSNAGNSGPEIRFAGVQRQPGLAIHERYAADRDTARGEPAIPDASWLGYLAAQNVGDENGAAGRSFEIGTAPGARDNIPDGKGLHLFARKAMRIEPLRQRFPVDPAWQLMIGDPVSRSCAGIPCAAGMAASIPAEAIDLASFKIGENVRCRSRQICATKGLVQAFRLVERNASHNNRKTWLSQRNEDVLRFRRMIRPDANPRGIACDLTEHQGFVF